MSTHGTEDFVLDMSQEPATAEDGPAVVDLGGDDTVADVDVDAADGDELPALAKLNEDGTVTLKLRFPQQLNVREKGVVTPTLFRTLTFKRLSGGDLRTVGMAPEGKQSDVLLGRTLGMPQLAAAALFDKLDAADAADALQVATSFFGSGPKKRT